jgi:hypothetical protein
MSMTASTAPQNKKQKVNKNSEINQFLFDSKNVFN